MMYTKDEFVRRMAKKGYTQKDCHQIIDDMLGTIQDVLMEGNGVKFRGFGAFEIRTRAARNGVNPTNGEKIKIPETKNVHFTPGVQLKRDVREALEG